MRTSYKQLCAHAATLSQLSGRTYEVVQGAPQGGKHRRKYAITMNGDYDRSIAATGPIYAVASIIATRLITKMADYA